MDGISGIRGRLFGYCRVSTTEQAADDRSPLEQQDAAIRSWAFSRDAEVERVYSDPGVSGSAPISERPGGRKMFAVLQPEDMVVVAKLDRMFRRPPTPSRWSSGSARSAASW